LQKHYNYTQQQTKVLAIPNTTRKYTEPLTEAELLLLKNKEAKDSKQYFAVYRILMIVSFVVPFITSWYRAYEGAPNAFSYIRYFFTMAVLLGIFTFATYSSYKLYHQNLQKDITDKTKTVETCSITKKVINASNNAYYFYTTSRVKISIEVSEACYYSLNEGDEISIEYTTHTQHYLGYF